MSNVTSPSPSLLGWPSQSESIFDVTVTSSLHHYAGLTAGFPGVNRPEEGCMVLDREYNPKDNPHNFISKQTSFWVSMINLVGVVPLLVLVGVSGNILSAAVFYRQGLRERINFCVFCLAVVDVLVLIVSFLLSSEAAYRTLIGPSNDMIKYVLGFTGLIRVSMFLSAVIASERCFCVVSPLRAQRMLSTRTLAVIIISVSLILLTGMLVIVGPKHTSACLFDPETNTTSFTDYVTDYYKDNKEILDIFDKVVYGSAIPLFFFVVIIVTTVITTTKLRSASRWRRQSSSASTGGLEMQMVALTRMLIATSVLFLVCLSPIFIMQVATFLVSEFQAGGRYGNLRSVIWDIILAFRTANSSFNFFVYCHMGSRFRQTLKEILPCKGSAPASALPSTGGRTPSSCSEGRKQRVVYTLSGKENAAFE